MLAYVHVRQYLARGEQQKRRDNTCPDVSDVVQRRDQRQRIHLPVVTQRRRTQHQPQVERGHITIAEESETNNKNKKSITTRFVICMRLCTINASKQCKSHSFDIFVSIQQSKNVCDSLKIDDYHKTLGYKLATASNEKKMHGISKLIVFSFDEFRSWLLFSTDVRVAVEQNNPSTFFDKCIPFITPILYKYIVFNTYVSICSIPCQVSTRLLLLKLNPRYDYTKRFGGNNSQNRFLKSQQLLSDRVLLNCRATFLISMECNFSNVDNSIEISMFRAKKKKAKRSVFIVYIDWRHVGKTF